MKGSSDTDRLVSIVICNHNYGAYLRQAVDSALDQTHPNVEVVAVDDGSTDDSREILASFGDRIDTYYQECGGQGAAVNTGFAASRGDVVLFLDADDVLRSTASASVVRLFDDPAVAGVQWRLTLMEADGRARRRLIPREKPPSGDLLARVLADGPDQFRWSPMSGCAWSRRYLDEVFPIPESLYRHAADFRLFELAPFYGEMRTLATSESFYRLHGRNDSRTIGFEVKLRRQLLLYEECAERAAERCVERGWAFDADRWRASSWWCRLARAVETVETIVPAGSRFVLVDEATWWTGGNLRGREVVPFTEREGRYWGLPASDREAVEEVERSQRRGAEYLVFAWPCLWMLDHYPGLHQHLRARYPCLLDDELLVAFRLAS